jgi:hypothetical protein
MTNDFEKKLAVAMFDVPIPDRLAERILERLERDRPQVVARTPTPTVTRTRRLPVSVLSLVATAAVLLVAIWLGTHRDSRLSEPFVLNEAIRTFNLGPSQPGYLLTEKPAAKEYAFSRSVVQLHGTRWRPLDGFLGHRGVVYDLPGPPGATASLYVLDVENTDGYATSPSLHPYTTAGCSASLWEESGHLYVLVVQGDTDNYRAYLNLPRGPVA